VASDSTGVYIVDYGNNRVLYYPGTGTTATRVYGQGGSFTSIFIPLSIDSLYLPKGIFVDSTGVYIADTGNNRVLFYPGTSTTATRVYGQGGSFTTNISNKGGVSANSLYDPQGVASDSTGVYILDTYNHRVLFYPGVTTTATRVYGQLGSLTTNTSNKGGISADSLSYPQGLAVNNSGVYIADTENERVLHYAGISTTATRVYGQGGSFTTNTSNKGGISADSLYYPRGVASDSTGVYIVDYGNNRVLYYAGASTTANRVYGQNGSFTTNASNNTTPGANTLKYPKGLALADNGLYVADTGNSRVLHYIGTSTIATTVYGQPDFTSNNYNIDGISATSLSRPSAIASDGVGLYVADNIDNRVLYYSDKDAPPPPPTATGTVKLLPNPVRMASTLSGDGLNSPKLTANGATPSASVAASTVEFTIGGKNNIPANATGIFGVLTNVGCSGGANFRFFVGNTVPNAANLNVPGANSALNLSTNFIAPLSGGKVKLGLGSGANVTCGYVLDVSGYIVAPDATADKVSLLPNTVRVASTLAGDGLNSPKLTTSNATPSAGVSSSTVEFSIGGKNAIPTDAKGIIGVLTNVGCNGGANFRFFTGTTVPNAANLNVPGALSSLNLSTGFIAALDNGKIKLGLGSGANVTCGYVLDVVGYINAPTMGGNDLSLLPATVRVNSTLAPQNNPALTSVGAIPANPISTSSLEITGANANGIPANAKGLMGVLTNVGCSGGGNFRFWTGATPPNAANLNIPGAFAALNLSTGFTTGLDANGKIKLGLASGATVKCGFVVDVVGFLN
jgi:hypothetical protein